MTVEHAQLRYELLSHLEKREHFNPDDTRTIICPYPVNMIGADHCETVKTVVDCSCILSYFRNNSSDIKLYCLELPGIFRIDPDNPYTDRSDYLTSFATRSALVFREVFGIRNGFTGVISLPFTKYGDLNELQVKLIVFCALHLINVDVLNLPGVGYINPEICSPTEYLALINSKKGCLLSLTSAKEDFRYRSYVNPLDDNSFIIAGIENIDPSCIEKLGYSNYRKVVTLAGLICNIVNIRSLSQVPREIFIDNISRFPSDMKAYAEHYYNDSLRISDAVSNWDKNETSSLGSLISSSALSKCRLAGNEYLVNLVKKISGIDGVRGTGLEFRKNTVQFSVLAMSDRVSDISNRLLNDKEIPITDPSSVKICNTCDGISVI